MQKWEYMWLSHHETEQTYVANGIKYNYQQYDTIFKVLDRLGAEGWELVTSPALGVFMLKRPLA